MIEINTLATPAQFPALQSPNVISKMRCRTVSRSNNAATALFPTLACIADANANAVLPHWRYPPATPCSSVRARLLRCLQGVHGWNLSWQVSALPAGGCGTPSQKAAPGPGSRTHAHTHSQTCAHTHTRTHTQTGGRGHRSCHQGRFCKMDTRTDPPCTSSRQACGICSHVSEQINSKEQCVRVQVRAHACSHST